MKIAGIVSEYNPMHTGHIYHINETRKSGATHIVSVMSGNFVQRGECAFLDKWSRADIAVHNGADLVVELPSVWSTDSAENFAYGAVSILSYLGVDVISFGSETDDKELLKNIALMKNENLSSLIINGMEEGLSYPSAFEKAVKNIYGEREAEVISSPNSTLGIEYIKALDKIGYTAEILSVKRKGACHDSDNLSCEFASASALRKVDDTSLLKNFVTDYEFEVLNKKIIDGLAPVTMKNGERAVISALRTMNSEELQEYTDDRRGLAGRIYKAVRTSHNIDELYENVKTKNVTMAKVRRTILRAYLGIKPEMSDEKPPYIKVLAANENGLQILKNCRADIPLITKHSDAAKLTGFAKQLYETECRCTDLYALFSKKIRACGMEQTSSMKIIK